MHELAIGVAVARLNTDTCTKFFSYHKGTIYNTALRRTTKNYNI